MKLFRKLLGKDKISTQVFEINLDNLQQSFSVMQHEAGWDTNEQLYWGYYFVDSNLNKIESFSDKLKKIGLQSVELRQVEGRPLYMLHVEEHSVHTANSLFEKCHKLANLAQENNIEVFDGWDVEQMPMNKGLVE